MEEIKQLSDDIIEQIKDFNIYNLNEEQKSLIDKLILDEKLNKNYKRNGLCNECKQPNNSGFRCQLCNPKRFQRNFKNWSSGNDDVDKFIQAQLKPKYLDSILEWIEHDRFENIEYLAKGGFGTVYKAIWKDGSIDGWDSKNNQWKRVGKIDVALKCLHNSQDITAEFLREVRFFFIIFSNVNLL